MRTPTALLPVPLLAALLAAGCGRDRSAATEPAPLVEARVPPAPPALLACEVSRVREDEPLDAVLRRLEVGAGERLAAVGALGAEVDLRRILPGEEVEIGRDAGGTVRRVVLRRDPRVSIVVELAPGAAPVARTLRAEPETWLRRIEGRIDGSLYESFLAAGADANLCMRFADLLAWQVDFLTDPRPGDRFLVLVEELRLHGAELGFGKILVAEYEGPEASARATRWGGRDGDADWYDDEGKSVRRAFLRSPLSYQRISSHFTARRRHPILKTVRPHWGVDYAAPAGTPVSALGAGVVTFAGRKGGFGNYVEVRHGSTYTTCYGHLSRFGEGVRAGRRVEQGQVLGYVGSTGLSTGPHLDFRVKHHGQFVDPLRLDAPPGRSLSGLDLDGFHCHRLRALAVVAALPDGEPMPESLAWVRVPVPEAGGPLLALAP